ncbi:hypothetical protein ACTVZO_15605 [Streptomyces sp. IBSNAI002]|uniref:hypothetical protein n=1 Tax=Streptomyces sp. IBSNAI002 TaxID=3457500 RepID=UPI003FD6B472
MTVTTHPAGPATAGDEPRTVCPAPAAEGPGSPAEIRRKTSTLHTRDVLALVGAAAASLALTTLLFGRVLPFNGPLGFTVVLYFAFMALYAVLVSLDENRSTVRARLAQGFAHGIAGLLLAGLLLVVGYAIVRGWRRWPTSTSSPRTCRAPARSTRSPRAGRCTPSSAPWSRSPSRW